jgi:hypothetical protein
MDVKNWLDSLEFTTRAAVTKLAESLTQLQLKRAAEKKNFNIQQHFEAYDQGLRAPNDTYYLNEQEALTRKPEKDRSGGGEFGSLFDSPLLPEKPVVYDKAYLDKQPQINTLAELDQFLSLETFRRFVLFGEGLLMGCDFLVYG